MSLTREQSREIDRRALEEFGIPGLILMENAGRGCAELLMDLNPKRNLSVIYCGAGNNGGDGFVIARHLWLNNWPVEIRTLGEHQHQPAEAKCNLEIARKLKLEFRGVRDPIPSDAWIVDALFGTGLNRSIWTPFVELVDLINASKCPVLAIDIPSGLDCDTGEPLGPIVRASHTATFVEWKKGFQNLKSREYTGDIFTIPNGFKLP